MEAPKCPTTITGRVKSDQTDPRSMPQARTYTCDRQDGDWHQVHHDPAHGLWKAVLMRPSREGFGLELD